MISRTSEGGEAPPSSRTPGTPVKGRPARSGTPSKKEDKDKTSKSSAKDVAELKDYVRRRRFGREVIRGLTVEILKQLGDCLGKGAFGSVYRALNWNTGETVAVKQIKLADLPKSELRVIMVRSLMVPKQANIFADMGTIARD